MAGILIIDDDSDDAEFLTDAFKNFGQNNIHHVSSAMEAFRYLDGLHADGLPEVVITDNFLPGKTGFEFIAQLKESERYSSIPVILLSATRSERDISRCKELGGLEYITKPAGVKEYLQVAGYIQSKLENR